MKTLLPFVLFVLLVEICPAQYQEVFKDDFSTSAKFKDLSTLLLWGNHQQPVSAFEIKEVTDAQGKKFSAIQLTSEAKGMGGYTQGTAYTSTAIDYKFSKAYRFSDTIKLEFDMYSEALSGNGESGRFGIAFMYDYPAEGPVYNDVYNKTETAPFGRPAYNLRLLNGEITSKQAYLFYGGGKDILGEFEKTGDIWLPGFISAPGGTSPGSQPDYPAGPVKIANMQTVNDRVWKHYTILLMPEKIECFWRNTSDSPDKNEKFIEMAIPKDFKPQEAMLQQINQMHQTNISQLPVQYHWFSEIEAIRFYFRSVQNSYLTNVEMSKTNHFLLPVVSFKDPTDIYISQDESQSATLAIQNPHPDFETKATLKLMSGDANIIKNNTERVIIFPVDDITSKTIDFQTDMSYVENIDTLTFELEIPSQSSLAISGSKKTLRLIVENKNITSVGKKTTNDFVFYPNPAEDFLRYKGQKSIHVKITDLSGRYIKDQSITSGSTINLLDIHCGIILLHIYDGDAVYVYKVLKK